MQYGFENLPERLKLPEAPRFRINVLTSAFRKLMSVAEPAETPAAPKKQPLTVPAQPDNYYTRRQQNIELDEQAIRERINGVFEEAA